MEWWVWLVIAAGVVLVLMVVGIILMKRRKGGGGDGDQANVEAAAEQRCSWPEKVVSGSCTKEEAEEQDEDVRLEAAVGFDGWGLVQTIDDPEKKKLLSSKSDDGDEADAFNGLYVGKLGGGVADPPSIGLGTVFPDPESHNPRPDPHRMIVKKLPSPPSVGNGRRSTFDEHLRAADEPAVEAEAEAEEGGTKILAHMHDWGGEVPEDEKDNRPSENGSILSPAMVEENIAEDPSVTRKRFTGYSQTPASRKRNGTDLVGAADLQLSSSPSPNSSRNSEHGWSDDSIKSRTLSSSDSSDSPARWVQGFRVRAPSMSPPQTRSRRRILALHQEDGSERVGDWSDHGMGGKEEIFSETRTQNMTRPVELPGDKVNPLSLARLN
ncbi:hypothetical protein GUITHDRAFT_143470 [Guillardia theta CCMP2712]|uniref:Uncharacterized protein n=1 Tax=Guillardia theta (strain CCMP2712) TaxID=905079 RepID=L1IU92_GUITC|nr:hypothetical protein GUITHDRAFT_143470 [Guillardia theta CCMP2712]EKX39474.1 hypothetical protein GUITHDRAFT_143470 [Guillardia theta CCMP2712]|eukprot:XP_005826454.1 hypothetical protein GUITHDRAFT_143470 [Guillardia theta CCMP2712]